MMDDVGKLTEHDEGCRKKCSCFCVSGFGFSSSKRKKKDCFVLGFLVVCFCFYICENHRVCTSRERIIVTHKHLPFLFSFTVAF